MSTFERFKDMLKDGRLPDEQGGAALTAQAKYDLLAAVNTMAQIMQLTETINTRSKRRTAIKEKMVESSRVAIRKMLDDDSLGTSHGLDAAIKVLASCRDELLKLEGEEHEEKVLKKLIADGITAKEY